MTFRQTIIRTVSWGMGFFMLCALVMSYVWYVDTASMVVGTHHEDVMSIRTHAPGSPSAVIEANDCEDQLSHEQDVYPTGVVYQTFDGTAHYSEDTAKVGKALDLAVNHKAWKGVARVNTFCK